MPEKTSSKVGVRSVVFSSPDLYAWGSVTEGLSSEVRRSVKKVSVLFFTDHYMDAVVVRIAGRGHF